MFGLSSFHTVSLRKCPRINRSSKYLSNNKKEEEEEEEEEEESTQKGTAHHNHHRRWRWIGHVLGKEGHSVTLRSAVCCMLEGKMKKGEAQNNTA